MSDVLASSDTPSHEYSLANSSIFCIREITLLIIARSCGDVMPVPYLCKWSKRRKASFYHSWLDANWFVCCITVLKYQKWYLCTVCKWVYVEKMKSTSSGQLSMELQTSCGAHQQLRQIVRSSSMYGFVQIPAPRKHTWADWVLAVE